MNATATLSRGTIPLNYQPYKMIVQSVTEETADTKTLRLAFADAGEAERFSFQAGQFGLYSLFGYGEATFCIASSPTRAGYIECTVKRAGKVTGALHELQVGDVMGFRGPYGNCFPLAQMAGHNLLFVAGGIGLAPVRSVIWNVLDLRDKFKDLTILYGARTVGDLVYKQELAEWKARGDARTIYTVDPGGETKDWDGRIGFVPTVLKEIVVSELAAREQTYVVMCGPPIMIKFTLLALLETGFTEDRIYTTLENRMKCGVGKCGRCNVGSLYVCKDGPVFTAAQLKALPNDF